MTPRDDDIPSSLEVWAAHTERTVTRQWQDRLDAPLPLELCRWATRAQARVARDLRHDVYRNHPDPITEELHQMAVTERMDESHALRTLIEAAERPPWAAVTALALAVASPWAGDRTLVRDRPQRRAPDPAAFQTFAARWLPDRRDTTELPTDRGPLAFAEYHKLLAPLARLRMLPYWLQDQALAGGFIARPPRGTGPDTDGRLLALGMLLAAIPPARRDEPGTALAITTVMEWLVGVRAALPTPGLSSQHRVMRWDPRHQMRWLGMTSTMTGQQLAVLRGRLWRLGSEVPPTWTRPPMTPTELQEAQERADDARRREAARVYQLARQR